MQLKKPTQKLTLNTKNHSKQTIISSNNSPLYEDSDRIMMQK